MPPKAKPENTALRFYVFLLIVLIMAGVLIYQWATRQPDRKEDEAAAPAPTPSAGPRLSPTTQTAASVPATAPRPASGPATPPATAPAASPWAVPLTDDEQTIYDAAHFRARQIDETGWYLMLSKTAELPRLDARQFEQLPRPAYDHLLQHPQIYGGQRMQMRIIPVRVTKLLPGAGMSHSPWWQPSDRPVWWVDCVNAMTTYPATQPIVLFTTIEPTAFGEPDEVDKDGTWLYTDVREVDVAAVFYKVYEAQDRDDNWRRYPVLLSWQIAPPKDWPKRSVGTTIIVLMTGMIVTVAVAYALVRHRSRRSAAAAAARRAEAFGYRPVRDEGGPPGPRPPADEDAAGVDPLLKRAAEEYEKERQHDGETNDPG